MRLAHRLEDLNTQVKALNKGIIVPKVQACPTCNKTLLRQKKENLWRCYVCKKDFPVPISRLSMAKGIRRDTTNLPILKRDDLIQKLSGSSDVQINALISLLFLTGGRVSEILSMQKHQVETQEVNGKTILLFKNRPILKKRKYGKQIPLQTVPIYYDQEPELCGTILYYVESLPKRDTPLFEFSRQKAWVLIRKVIGEEYCVHWLRHSRVTDMVLRKRWNEQTIVKFLGWSDSRQFGHYTHLRWQELAELTKED